MKKKIIEVQNYFADKLARGLYKVEIITSHTIRVIVDRKYIFRLWVANEAAHFETYSGIGGNFMTVKFTDAQKKTGFKKALGYVRRWEATELKEKELAELKKLQHKYPETSKA